MLNSLTLECKKLKHKHFFLFLFAFFFLFTVWIQVTVFSSGKNISDLYYIMLYTVPILNTILLPIFIAVVSSKLWDIEQKGHTYKLLLSLQPAKELYIGKSFLGAFFLFLVSIGESIICIFLGKLFCFHQSIPIALFLQLTFSTFFVSLMLYFMQQILAFFFSNQAITLALGVLGSFVGLFSIFFARNFQKFILWTYYCLFDTISMQWDPHTHISTYSTEPITPVTYIFTALFLLIFYILGQILFERKEI